MGDAHADVVVVERALRRAAVVDLDVHRAGPVRDDLQAVGAVAQERVAEHVGGDRAAVGLQQQAVVARRHRVGVAERAVGDVQLRQRARRVDDPRVVLGRVRDERARELRVAGEVREVQAGLVGGGVVAVVVDDRVAQREVRDDEPRTPLPRLLRIFIRCSVIACVEVSETASWVVLWIVPPVHGVGGRRAGAAGAGDVQPAGRCRSCSAGCRWWRRWTRSSRS